VVRHNGQGALGQSGGDKAAVRQHRYNRVIFNLGGNKYRLVVHVSFAFGRVLVKFLHSLRIRPHRSGDRIMAKKMIRSIRSEADYDAALVEIERYFENEPVPGTPDADHFDLLDRRTAHIHPTRTLRPLPGALRRSAP
jgi:hypothetical protein